MTPDEARAKLAAIIADAGNDISFGLWQQTVAYAPIGDQSQSVANITAVRAALFNVETAGRIAAPQYARYWQKYGSGEEALGRYNWPALGLVGNPNRPNIERAWAASAAYIQQEGPPMGDHSYQFGFADLAERLGAGVVGAPVTDEFPVGAGPESGTGATLQVTDKGLMVYASGGAPGFLPFQQG